MEDSPTQLKALEDAIERFGSQSAMARHLGVSQPSVSDWVRRMGRIPPEHVLAVEAATGISRHVLRPDIYPIEDTASPGPQPGVTSPAGSEFQAAGGVSSREPEGQP